MPRCAAAASEVVGLHPLLGKHTVSLRTGKDGACHIAPQNRRYGIALSGFQPLQDSIRIGMGTTVKTPSHGDGIIEDKGGHARPCSIIERIVSPSGKKVPLRSSRIRAAASAGVRFLI